MAILTATNTLSVGDATILDDTVVVTVINTPQIEGVAQGRLAHPGIGTYDYEKAPDEWTNMYTDVIIPPTWSSTKTLTWGQHTLWAGNIRDVEVYEKWNGRVAMKGPQFTTLLNFWVNPPTPPDYIIWSPNYLNSNSYKVIIVGVTSGTGSAVNLDYTLFQGSGFIKGPVTLKMRLVNWEPPP